MAVSIVGIIINVILLIVIIILVIIGVRFNSELKTCETKQSTFCYTIQCPCDDDAGVKQPPCFGYAKQPADTPGQWYCSNAPLTAVNDQGQLVKQI